MNERHRARLVRLIAVVAIAAGGAAAVAPSVAAAPASVDFTVRESLLVDTPGVMIASDVPGCGSATVATHDASSSQYGPFTVFTGTKDFDCGGGNSFSLRFRAVAFECSSHDWGTWRLTGGTGMFAGARGSGLLVGSYRSGDDPGTSCVSDGIDDRYIGRLRLAP